MLEWGDIPTWVASIGTVVAVSLALYQARGARREAAEAHRLGLAAWELSREESHRRRQERADYAARQARQIVSYVTNGSPTGVVHVTNTSDEPVGALVVEAAYLDNVFAPANWTYALGPGASVNILNARQAFRVPVEFRDGQGELLPLEQTRGATVDISFVDSRGIRWRRWALVQPRHASNAAVHREPAFEPRRHNFGSAKDD
ncbi:hypothetical protein [Intrasporangium flavum]|uniref:hypothetical protein n=1 Tax=Intrasporangium flavum TaxID=1428657 RepID=UPI001A96361A|nr:hypothetical protein [Intrasporangium flavum]